MERISLKIIFFLIATTVTVASSLLSLSLLFFLGINGSSFGLQLFFYIAFSPHPNATPHWAHSPLALNSLSVNATKRAALTRSPTFSLFAPPPLNGVGNAATRWIWSFFYSTVNREASNQDPSSHIEMNLAAGRSRKRKLSEERNWASAFSLDELNEDLLEKVLSWLPASSFLRLRGVCKRWNSIASSATFQMACAQIPSREPWFLMVDQDLEQSIVFDTSELRWKNLSPPIQYHHSPNLKPIPVAASDGRVCYRTVSGELKVCNPVTGACIDLPKVMQTSETTPLHAIAMNSSPNSSSSYSVVLVYSDFSNLAFTVFDSMKGTWQTETILVHKTESSLDSHTVGGEVFYFLSKTGDVVATNMQRSPSKQYSSVLTIENGEEVVYFISHSGTVVACNLAEKTFCEYPRLLPIYFEYSIDVVECNGEMLVVLLSEYLETASMRVWRFSKEDRLWQQVAAMPPSMSHSFYGKKLDINCSGWGDMIVICVNSSQYSSCVMLHIEANEWVELPECFVSGNSKNFMSAFSFEPRFEVVV